MTRQLPVPERDDRPAPAPAIDDLPSAPDPLNDLALDALEISGLEALLDPIDDDPEGEHPLDPLGDPPERLPELDLFNVPDDAPDLDPLEQAPDNPDAYLLPEAPDPAVLPWETQAVLPDLGMQLRALLDPTRPHSSWVDPDPPAGPAETLVHLGGLELRVVLVPERGTEPCLRLGRDALAGRIWVRSEPA